MSYNRHGQNLGNDPDCILCGWTKSTCHCALFRRARLVRIAVDSILHPRCPVSQQLSAARYQPPLDTDYLCDEAHRLNLEAERREQNEQQRRDYAELGL